jgi:glucokinase
VAILAHRVRRTAVEAGSGSRFIPVDVALAVDIGGTKLAAGLVTPDGRVLGRRSAPTGAEDAEGLFRRLAAVVDDVLAAARAGDHRSVVCGVGCGGPMTPGGAEVSPLNIPAWRGFRLRARLRDHTGLPVHVDNDAKALALGEGWVGAAAGVPNFIAMVVSTGVGGGIVLDGRLLEGASGNAGHIGHVIVVPGGRVCGCGAQGCLEAEASGLAIAAITGRPPAEAAPEVVARTGRLVGRAVASVANLLDLRLAVVAGSVALGYGEPFFRAAQEELAALSRLEFSADAVIRSAGLGDTGPLIGAAAVGWRGLSESADVGT